VGLQVERTLKLLLTTFGVKEFFGSSTALNVPVPKLLKILTVADDGAPLHDDVPHVKTNCG
jgi:hypothetical protein